MGTMYSMIASNPKGFSDVALSRSAFVATNPTSRTGIATADAVTSYSATAALMNVYNAAATDGTEPYVIIPCWLKLTATAANTNATDFSLDFYLDQANRYSSGGSAITEQALIQSAEADFTDPTSKATIHFGELTLAAATDANLVSHLVVANAALAAEDVIEVYWGDMPGSGARDGTVIRGAGPFTVPPMWIRPGANMSIHEYGASQSASFDPEFEFFYIEKPNANSAT